MLRSGALPAPLEVLEERTVGAGLGADSIQEGIIASIIGLAAVVVFMVAAYGLFGVFTTITVFINLFLMLGALSFMGATLTLPGIAGIILTIGMAVDANVLIFERMREEVKAGRSTKDAAEAGFTEAWGTIVDSNLTTLVAALVLFYFGTGPVRGFAVTLAIGIADLNVYVGNRHPGDNSSTWIDRNTSRPNCRFREKKDSNEMRIFSWVTKDTNYRLYGRAQADLRPVGSDGRTLAVVCQCRLRASITELTFPAVF